MSIKSFFAGLLTIPLGVAELGEHPQLATLRGPEIDSGTADSLAQPHAHADTHSEEVRMNLSAAGSGSSGRVEDSFQLFIEPQPPGFRLNGAPMGNYQVITHVGPLASLRRPEFEAEPPQPMFGYCENIEQLRQRMEALDLQPVQLNAVLRVAASGGLQAVSGYNSKRTYYARQLRNIGMSYRPLN